MDANRSTRNHVALLAKYPETVLEAISIYYPLPLEWLRKYGDILRWGAVHNVDMSEFSSEDSYEPGIISNSAIQWTNDVRALVFANLLTNGGDHDLRFVRCDLWNSCTLNSSDTWETCASQAMLGLIRFVRRCPLNLEFVIESHAAAIHEHFRLEFMEHFDLDPDNRYVAERFANANPDYWKSRDWEASLTLARERFQPSISHKLTIDEWLNLSEQRNVPCLLANPALWNLTLAEMLDSNSVQELLNLLYTQHLHRNGECLEVPGQNSQVCPTLCGNDAPPSEATVTGLTDSASGVATDAGDAAAVDHDELPEEYEPDDPNDYPMLASDNPYYNSDVDMDQQSEEFWDSL